MQKQVSSTCTALVPRRGESKRRHSVLLHEEGRQFETNEWSSERTASPLKADILLRLGGVGSVPKSDTDWPRVNALICPEAHVRSTAALQCMRPLGCRLTGRSGQSMGH